MKQRTLNNQDGIALGPILFIIAILAILAGAIAAGSGSFTANTNAESAKAMAEVIVNQCGAYQDAVNLMLQNECDETKLDWTPNGGGYPTGLTWNSADYTGGNGTNQSGNGQCAMFDPRGGGMIYKKISSSALFTPTSGQFTAADGGADANLAILAGYPIFYAQTCIIGTGTCGAAWEASTNPKSTPVYIITYLNYNTCVQIDKLLGISQDPLYYELALYLYDFNLFNNVGFQDGTGVMGGGFYDIPGRAEGCASDYYSNNHWSSGVYAFMCPLMIR